MSIKTKDKSKTEKTKKEPVIEGYWGETPKDKTHPWPEANNKPWLGQDFFVSALLELQEQTHQDRYKGGSECRLCKKHNGSTEYRTKEYLWPSGLLHYVTEHNVKPSDKFVSYVVDEVRKKPSQARVESMLTNFAKKEGLIKFEMQVTAPRGYGWTPDYHVTFATDSQLNESVLKRLERRFAKKFATVLIKSANYSIRRKVTKVELNLHFYPRNRHYK